MKYVKQFKNIGINTPILSEKALFLLRNFNKLTLTTNKKISKKKIKQLFKIFFNINLYKVNSNLSYKKKRFIITLNNKKDSMLIKNLFTNFNL